MPIRIAPPFVARLSMWLVALLPCLPANSQQKVSPTIPNRKSDFHLFVLAGQSNMAGRGAIAEADRQPHPRIWMLDQTGDWVPARDPLHFDKPAMVGVGPGRSFALEYAAAHPKATVGLIPCAVGGSPLDSWTIGGYHEQTQSRPLDECLARVAAVKSQGTVKGVLWHQGESDAKPGLAEQYEAKLISLIHLFRKQFDAPELPFLIGQLGKFEDAPWTSEKARIDQAHRRVVTRVPFTEFVSTDGLDHKGDRLHFDAASARKLGRRYFHALRWLHAKRPRLTLTPSDDNPRNSEGDFIRLADGRLLFVYTRFRDGSSDHAAADLVSRVSQDAGATWSEEDRLVVANEGDWNVMSVSLLRMQDGRIALFYMLKNSLSDCRPVVRFSSDEGASWSEPRSIVPASEVGYYVLNNDRVVQLSDGRLIVPLALHNRPDWEQPDWSDKNKIYYSNDDGASWQRTETVQPAHAPSGERIMAQEPGVVELDDGDLLMWIRTDAGWQYRSLSSDRGVTWSKFEPMSLASPRSPASIERIPATGDLLAVWNDHSNLPEEERKLRTPLSAAISQDDGETWSVAVPLSTAADGWYCYTAIDFVDDFVLLGHCAGKQAPGMHLSATEVRRLPLVDLYRQADLPIDLE